jgi:hypothetical protein
MERPTTPVGEVRSKLRSSAFHKNTRSASAADANIAGLRGCVATAYKSAESRAPSANTEFWFFQVSDQAGGRGWGGEGRMEEGDGGRSEKGGWHRMEDGTVSNQI